MKVWVCREEEVESDRVAALEASVASLQQQLASLMPQPQPASEAAPSTPVATAETVVPS